MGKFSTYRYLELKDDTSASHISNRSRSLKQPRKLRKIFLLLIVAVLCATYFMGLFANKSRVLDGIAKALGYQYDYYHAVVIDAGSSGSRVLAYKFRVPFTVFGETDLDLVDEYFEQSKPGLSSFADDPEKGAESIVQLIRKAEHLVSPEKRNTSLIVRATAGLRLLPHEKANRLIEAVREAVRKLGYDTNDKSVDIMDGADEGIYIWYTVNLLHNMIETTTMAALDLGGGSTQITYQVSDDELSNLPSSELYSVPTGGHNITLYTHSYLNLGLLAARHGILRLDAPENETVFTSPCIDPIITNEPWHYANKNIYVSGTPRPAHKSKNVRQENFNRCQSAIRRYVTSQVSHAAPLRAPLVAAMSFYYDIAADAGIIDVMRGGSVTVSQYKQAALRACSASNIEQPWECMDLLYVLTLLTDLYNLPINKKIELYKKVNGHEVSWALGLAYTTVIKRLTQPLAA